MAASSRCQMCDNDTVAEGLQGRDILIRTLSVVVLLRDGPRRLASWSYLSSTTMRAEVVICVVAVSLGVRARQLPREWLLRFSGAMWTVRIRGGQKWEQVSRSSTRCPWFLNDKIICFQSLLQTLSLWSTLFKVTWQEMVSTLLFMNETKNSIHCHTEILSHSIPLSFCWAFFWWVFLSIGLYRISSHLF